MAIFRGTGGSVGGITDADILLISISQGGTGATTASGARTNLGLGTAATTDASAYATAAQGAKADTALQSFTETDPIFTASEAASITSTDTTNWDTAYTDRLKWDGGSTGLNASTARTSLGLGTAATTDATAYATSAQGAKADSAVQPGSLATVATSGSYNDLSNKPTIPTNLDSLTDVVITSPTTNQTIQYNGTNWVNATASGSGTVTSVAMSVPTGLSVSGSPITGAGTLAVTYASGYSIPTTTKQTEWDTAYTDRLKWDGGSTGLNAATGRTSLGLGTAATTAATDYATAAQGTKADNALTAANPSFTGTLTGTGDIRLNNGNADGAQLQLASSGYSDWNLDNFSGRFRAYYGSTEYFTINTSGNVGVGTTTPTTKLDVSGTVTATSVNTQNTFGFKNRIINGAMMIDQRNAGASVTQTTAFNYIVDRWFNVGSVTSKFTSQQNAGSVTPPSGFINYLGNTSSAATSLGAGDYYFIGQKIEGLNAADLGWGTASAASVTLSFWVRSSLTGTFGGSIQNSAQNRAYPFTYTISSANTWEQKTITIAGDTSGTWLTTNGIGIAINFSLGTGTTYSGTAGAWAGSAFYSATGATSVVGTNGATFYITGVQLEKGSTDTSFDYRPYGTELALCQRYYSLNTPGAGRSTSTTRMSGTVGTPVPMRATPTVSLFSGTNKAIDVGVAFRNVTAVVALEGATEYGGNIQADLSTTNSGTVHTYLGGCFAWSAEL